MTLLSYGYPGLVLVAAPGVGATFGEDYLEHLLNRATDILDARIPSLRARVEADDELRERADRVAADMVARLLRNPDGARSRTSTKGPFSESVTFGDTPSGLVLMDDELASLLPARGTARAGRRLGSIRLQRPW